MRITENGRLAAGVGWGGVSLYESQWYRPVCMIFIHVTAHLSPKSILWQKWRPRFIVDPALTQPHLAAISSGGRDKWVKQQSDSGRWYLSPKNKQTTPHKKHQTQKRSLILVLYCC